MPSSSATKKTEDVLEKVLRTIREEYESPFPVLCETDWNRFVSEEERFGGSPSGRKDDADRDLSTVSESS